MPTIESPTGIHHIYQVVKTTGHATLRTWRVQDSRLAADGAGRVYFVERHGARQAFRLDEPDTYTTHTEAQSARNAYGDGLNATRRMVLS